MAERVERAAKRRMRPVDFHINVKCKPIKNTVEEPLADLESENNETWQKLHGHAIAAGERPEEKINESVPCRFCQESIELEENLGSKNGLGSTGIFDVSVPERKSSVARN